jgi:hypothetical protein
VLGDPRRGGDANHALGACLQALDHATEGAGRLLEPFRVREQLLGRDGRGDAVGGPFEVVRPERVLEGVEAAAHGRRVHP